MKKYVLLRSMEYGSRFFTMSGGRSEYDIVRTNDGKISYEIIDYADTIANAQIKLYGRSFTTSLD